MLNFKASCQNLFAATMLFSAFTMMSCNNDGSSNTANDTTGQSDTMATSQQAASDSGAMAEAVLSGTHQDTTVTGTVQFRENNNRVKMTLDVTIPKMANKSVAVHIHEHGSCGDMGKEAHGHWNPTKENHGKWGTAPFHRGDIGNVDLNGEGRGTMELETDLWTISGSDSTKNILNKAIIVHGGKDDFKTQPTGNAGSRLGCGVIMMR